MGSNGTGTSKSSGSNTSVSWYKDRGRGQTGDTKTEEHSATPPGQNNTHVYENYVTESEKVADVGGVTRAIIHQESFENEAFLSSQLESPYPYSEDVLDGTDSPPLDCNKTLLSSKSDRTM